MMTGQAWVPPVIEEVSHHGEDSLAEGEGNVDEVSYEVFIGDPGQQGNLLSRPYDLYRQTEAQYEETLALQ